MSGTIIGIANAFGSSLTPGTVGQGQAPTPTPGAGPMTFFVTPYNSGGTSTPSGQYQLGLYSTGTYNFTVSWGDGSSDDVITSYNQPEATHDYGVVTPADRFLITITPNTAFASSSFDHWFFGNRTQGDGVKVTSINLYGGVQFYANEDVFYGCESLTTVNTSINNIPTFVNKDIIDSFFFKCTNLSISFTLSYWVGPFTGTAIDFNGGTEAGGIPTGSSNGYFNFDFAPTSLLRAFENQATFNNQSLNNWDVSGSNDFSSAFEGCLRFNNPLPWTFQTGSPILATDMFKNAVDFNQDITAWDTSAFTKMDGMFARTLSIGGPVLASSFNQPIALWNTNSVQDASAMFFNAEAFNRDLTNWFSTGSLVNTSFTSGGIVSMFSGASNFNGQVLNWDTSNLTGFGFVFNGASAFNQDLSRWDTSSGQVFVSTFNGATSFNQDLSSWDVSMGLFFDEMFKGATSFLGTGIDSWNTASAFSFSSMFNGASAFNQNLYSWDISNLTNASDMLTGTAISNDNWDSLLIGWGYAQQANLNNNVTLSDVPAQHGPGFVNAIFDKLTDSVANGGYGWTILDQGQSALPPPPLEFTIDTTATETGSSANDQYRLPLMSTGTYNFYVDWGDGTIGDQITSWNQAEATHTYATAGTYIVQILATARVGQTPSVDHISWASQNGTTLTAANDRLKVQGIAKWGSAQVYLNEYVFTRCSNLDITTTALPNFGSKVLRTSAFENCDSLSGNLSGWGTSGSPVTGDAAVLYSSGGLNPNLNFVLEASGTLLTSFLNASNFNTSLSNWDVSSVTSLSSTFRLASAFNQDISTWDTSSVTSLSSTFRDASAFDQNLASWDVGSVTTASDMFTGSGLSAANWDSILVGWAAQGTGAGSLQPNVTLSNINQYHGTVNAAATAAYNKLTAAPYNWNIVDLGETPTSSFDFEVNTANTRTGSTNADQYRLPLISTGTYNFTVNWGDGNSNTITTWNQAEATHTYASSGTYSISITGTIDHVCWSSQNGSSFSEANDRLKLLDISSWGSAVVYLSERVLFDCSNMDITDTNPPTFGDKVMLQAFFFDCENLSADLTSWGTVASPVTGSVREILAESSSFNPNLNFVFVGSSLVYRAFRFCLTFNNPLDNWSLSGSSNFVQVFNGATSFNQDISGWDVSSGTMFVNMFGGASAFNQDISSWDMSSATSLQSMFQDATAFNQPIGTWNTSSVTNMQSTFEDATAFDQNLANWDVGSLTTATDMFTNSGLSAANWDALLIGWAAQGTGAGSLQANVTLSDINQVHGSVDSAATAAYNKLTASPYNWTIVDLGGAPVGNLLLDTSYGSGAEAAYSVRKLRTAYTGPAIKVQDTVGGATQDIYFDANNNLDEAAIISYGGSNDVFVETWYDQSVNGNDAEQPSSTLRPKIYDGTTGALVKENGKVALDFDGSNDSLTSSTPPFTGTTNRTSFTVSKANTSTSDDIIYGINSIAGATGTAWQLTAETQLRVSGRIAFNNSAQTIHSLGTLVFDGTTVNDANFYLNGSITTQGTSTGATINTSNNDWAIGNTPTVNTFYDGKQQELIFYASAKSTTDRTDIEENIGDYFTQNTPLLDTYSGAAAAYSLRLLDSTYTGSAVQVQDAVGGATQDIGFNVFGELDTVSLAAYGGSNDVFVATWYDQSGNSNDATQGTSANRPKIYDGATASVVTDGSAGNEKPALDFDGVSENFTSTISNITQSFDVYTVHNFNTTPAATERLYDSDNGGRITRGSNNTSNNFAFAGTVLSWSPQQTGQVQETTVYNGASSLVRVNGTQTASGDAGTNSTGTDLVIGADKSGTTQYIDGQIQEIIIFDNSKSTSDRTGIETNINTFYDIYTEPVAPLLLNNYPGAAAAYSLRRINSSYQGSAVLVQTALNTKGPVYIGFDSNNDLDTVSLAAYGGSEEVVVAGWLDQSGNGNDAIQNSASARPVIYRDSTATTPGVVTENGKPAVDFDGTSDYLSNAGNLIYTSGLSIYSVSKFDSLSNTERLFCDDITGAQGFFIYSSNGYLQINDNNTGYLSQTLSGADLTQQVRSLNFNGSTGAYNYAYNGSNTSSSIAGWTGPINSTNTANIGVMGSGNGSQLGEGLVQEIITYPSDQSTNRANIEDNIGGYYDIVLPGLLDENPGAAAAYSLRRLSSTYTGSAIQVQRADNVGGTTDIGFDGYGNLDTAALTTAAAGNSMVVATWYDQSGNSNDATQGTSANRPKIYDGTTGVVTENGKPAVEFDGNHLRTTTSAIARLDVRTNFFVFKESTAINFRRVVCFAPSTGNDYWNTNSSAITTGEASSNRNIYIDLGGRDNAIDNPNTTKPTPYNLLTLTSDGTSADLYFNGSNVDTGTLLYPSNQYHTGNIIIGAGGNNSGTINKLTGIIQEIVVYNSDQDTAGNRTGIETNINTFYNIY